MTTATFTDPYHSRTTDTWESASRVDPTVWGDTSGPLTPQQLESYQRDGFLFFPNLLTGREVESLVAEAKSLSAEWPSERAGLVREPDSDVVRSIFRLHHFSDLYQRLFADARLVGKARQLLGSDVYIHQSRINYKPALDGKEFFWHSDFETWHVEDGMPRMRAVSMSVFLTESHEFNGPLMLIPGSHETYIRCAGETPVNHHEQSLRRQEYGVPSREALKQLVHQSRGIEAPKGSAGSVVFFECNTMHGSCGNLSPEPRVNLFAVYNSVENSLVDPFCNRPPRPAYLAEREVTAID
ncbi:MAG: ectoine hydroxylase [Planctomycetaceae bacterium]|nr:ectoine hydroxylase [Planctomycetaceae bacterium]